MGFLPFLAEAAKGSGEQPFMQTIIMIVVTLFFLYFILFRPEQKRRKKLEKQRSGMKKGDKVTAMGIIGTIVKINENTIILSMVDGAKIEMLKHAITEVHASPSEEKEEQPAN